MMSYQKEREEFVSVATRHGLPFNAAQTLLRTATTLQRLAELACSSEAADRDRIPCPASLKDLKGRPRKVSGPCLCDLDEGEHRDIPRIRLQDHRAELRAEAAVPDGWQIETEGDPRGYVLRVIPPSYAERNAGRDRFNRDAIGVPSGPSRLRW
jgi:hypothetical protein